MRAKISLADGHAARSQEYIGGMESGEAGGIGHARAT